MQPNLIWPALNALTWSFQIVCTFATVDPTHESTQPMDNSDLMFYETPWPKTVQARHRRGPQRPNTGPNSFCRSRSLYDCILWHQLLNCWQICGDCALLTDTAWLSWVLKIPPHLAYVATLPCKTSVSAKQAINDKFRHNFVAYSFGR